MKPCTQEFQHLEKTVALDVTVSTMNNVTRPLGTVRMAVPLAGQGKNVNIVSTSSVFNGNSGIGL